MKMTSGTRALDKIYKRRNRYEIPEWQRQEVWARSKKQSLIDTILRGWKLPKFYFLEMGDNPEEYEVVDGQQRLVAIWEFFDNELPLSSGSTRLFGAEYYKNLSDALQDHFDDYEIEFDLIEDASDADVKEFFQRLQDGLPLTSSEKLNSVHSKLRDFAAKLAKHSFLQNKVTVSDKRYGHFDIVAKAAAIEIDGLEVGMRYDDLRVVFDSQSNFSTRSNVAKRLQETLEFLNRAFRRPDKRLRNRTIVQSLITLAGRLVDTGKENDVQKKFAQFFKDFLDKLSKQVQLGHNATDQDYIAFQRTVTANVRSGPKTRQQILLRKLLLYDPSFANLFDSKVIADSGFAQQIKSDSEVIAELINTLNQVHSSKYGQDLFKPTNKTVKSLLSVSKVIRDYAGYATFIDNLYFLFYEGIGQRIADKVPHSFKDIKDLRTSLRHDVDHGKTAKTHAKRKKLGETFRKYAGISSPEAMAPEQFPVVQAGLMQALRKDLQKLRGQL